MSASLQSSAMDTVMGNTDYSTRNEPPSLQNGFVDSRDLDKTTSSLNESQDGSESSTEATVYPEGRKLWLPTGCCYDDRMRLHANADFEANANHPEDPRRIQAIMEAFKMAGLVYDGPELELAAILKESPTKFMYRIAARRALPSEICLAHAVSHFEWVKDLNNKTSAELREMTKAMDNGRKSLYVGNLTYEAAIVAAGGAIETCKNVVVGRVKNAIAIIRPPGHHAEHGEALGFCIFNNVPIAAKVCMEDYPELCRKILIVDWDVHHGNGIQNMFYENPNVLYISLHVYQGGGFYPNVVEGIPDGDLDKVGSGLGIGRNVNIGWHDQGMGDAEYMAAFQRIVMPIAEEFDPDFVIISAGFDAAAGDELGGCFVTPACYSHMTHMLMSLANGKLAVCLEGGYDLPAIKRSALAVAKTLMGEPPIRIKVPPINRQAEYVLQEVKIQQAPYWECMRLGVASETRLIERGDTRVDAVMRGYQLHELQTEFSMIPLYIQRDKLVDVFEKQVLVTPQIHASKKVVLILHDP
jgi:histone deacetylase 6